MNNKKGRKDFFFDFFERFLYLFCFFLTICNHKLNLIYFIEVWRKNDLYHKFIFIAMLE